MSGHHKWQDIRQDKGVELDGITWKSVTHEQFDALLSRLDTLEADKKWWTAVNEELLPYQARAVAAEAQVEALTEALRESIRMRHGDAKLYLTEEQLDAKVAEALSRVPTEKSRAWKEFIENPQRHETTESEWENDGGSV